MFYLLGENLTLKILSTGIIQFSEGACNEIAHLSKYGKPVKLTATIPKKNLNSCRQVDVAKQLNNRITKVLH